MNPSFTIESCRLHRRFSQVNSDSVMRGFLITLAAAAGAHNSKLDCMCHVLYSYLYIYKLFFLFYVYIYIYVFFIYLMHRQNTLWRLSGFRDVWNQKKKVAEGRIKMNRFIYYFLQQVWFWFSNGIWQSRTGTGAVCVIGLWSYHLFLICSGITTRDTRHEKKSENFTAVWPLEFWTPSQVVAFFFASMSWWCNFFLLQIWPCFFYI